MTAATHMHASTLDRATAIQLSCECILKQSSKSRVVQWAHEQFGCVLHYVNMQQQPEPKLWSFNMLVLKISLVSLSNLVIQVDLSKLKTVRCGQLTLHCTLDHWQRPSRWVKSCHNLRTKPYYKNPSANLQNDTHTHTQQLPYVSEAQPSEA